MKNEIMTTNSINALVNKEIKSNLKTMLQAVPNSPYPQLRSKDDGWL